MNKIFKQSSLVQSVACSEITTSKAGRAVATTLALAIVSSFATQAQAQAQITDATNHTVDFKIKNPDDKDPLKEIDLKGTLGQITTKLFETITEANKESNDRVKIVQNNLAVRAGSLEKNVNAVAQYIDSLRTWLVDDVKSQIDKHDERLNGLETNKDANDHTVNLTIKDPNGGGDFQVKTSLKDFANNMIKGFEQIEKTNTEQVAEIDRNIKIVQDNLAAEAKFLKKSKADNEKAINQNRTNIGILRSYLDEQLVPEFNAHDRRLDRNEANITQNSKDIEETVKYINAVNDAVDKNEAAITQNEGKIAANTTSIQANTGKIAANEGKIAANTTSIQANTGKIAANEGKIAANTTSIQANTGKIAANTTSIQAKANAADLKAANERITTIADQYNTLNTSVDTVSNNYRNLDTKVGKMDKGLSAGIASAVALGMMPAPAAGSQYITGGTGFYNGQSAVAVGLTGATESGKVTYKLGGSLTSSGASTFGAGAGYRWK